MPLNQVDITDYHNAVNSITEILLNFWDRIDWIIYWSFITWKIKPWLSDIDTFLLCKDSENIWFPIDISIALGEVKILVERTWVPVQINKQTMRSLNSMTFSPEYNYLMEVQKWASLPHASKDFSDMFMQLRDQKIDDSDMLRHFFRKVNSIWENLAKSELIVQMKETRIWVSQQKDLWKLWDDFKKMLSLCTLAVRLKTWKSLFSQSDTIIIEKFNEIFQPNIDMSRYLQVLNKIQDIKTWYEYLKDWGVEEIQEIYTTIFIPFMNAVDKKLLLTNNSKL